MNTQAVIYNTSTSVLNTEVSSFQGAGIEEFHCIIPESNI